MSMFNLTEQLNGSFEELMVEIRAMRRELEQMRRVMEEQAGPGNSVKPVKAVAVKAPRARTRPHARSRTTAA